MYLRAIDGHACPECPMGSVARAGWQGEPSGRDLASALNCALLSDCPGRVVCLERVARFIEGRQPCVRPGL